jgi:hydrogenase maturation protease
MQRVAVLVLGGEDRGDDVAAQAAVRLLPEDVRNLADLRICDQLDPAVLIELAAEGPLLIVDAMRGPAAGSIRAWPLEELATHGRGPERPVLASTHVLPITDTLALAQVVTGRPLAGRFVALAGVNFGLGSGLSPEVAGSLTEFATVIAAEIAAMAADMSAKEREPQCA